jgi:hypothetical protein
MFSSTHLIRKSKELFDSLINNEIDKAVILRDGKPNFILLNFTKYEKIMNEYQELKILYKNVNTKNNTKIKAKNTNLQTDEKPILTKEDSELKKTLDQLEDLDLDDDFKEEASKKLKEQPIGEIKEFWN